MKLSRIIRRRSIAKDVSDLGLVKINGKVAKPSTEVKEGDMLVLTLGERRMTVRVRSVSAGTGKKEASGMFEILSDEVMNPASES